MKHVIEISGVFFEVQRKAIKHIYLRVDPYRCMIQVSAPVTMSEPLLSQQLAAKHAWALKQLQKTPPTTLLATNYLPGDLIPYLGHTYQLTFDNEKPNAIIDDLNKTIILASQPAETAADRKHQVNQWYRIQMAQLLPPLIQQWENTIGVTVASWHIRAMKTRWGSCHLIKNRICLNLALITKPIACLESVLVHEMVHLLEPRHNARFYSLMDHFFPYWKEAKKQLDRIYHSL